MNLRKRSSLTTLTPILLLLALLALLAPAAASALDRTVSASAEASLRVRSDTAKAGFAVAAERRSRGAALHAASSGLRRVLATLDRVPGVGQGDVTTGRISVETTRQNGKTFYRATGRVAVVLHQPRKAGALVDAALAAGATRVSGPFYFVADPKAAFAKVLGMAFDRAKAQAAALAAQAGATLGEVISIDEGEGPYLASEKASGAGFASPFPVRPGASTVSAYVHVVFALQ
jgi:uncharacterized protein YggE